jgi:hypothetical protein
MSNTVTLGIMLTAFIVLGALDIWFALDSRKGNTYSENIRKWGRVWPPVRLIGAFILGLLAGHFWWSPVEYIEYPSIRTQAPPP